MMKRVTFSVLLLTVMLIGCGATSFVWHEGDFDSAMAKADSEGKLLIIDFWSDN
jgi:hypothetical protein